ncbi:MAG: hypothetical protein WC695_11430 [Candidatus Omnitrophota bacterium]
MKTAITPELLEQMSNLQIALLAAVEAQVGHTVSKPSRAVIGAKEVLSNTLQLLHYQLEHRGDETMQEDIDHLKKKYRYVVNHIEQEKAKRPKPLHTKIYIVLKKRVCMALQHTSKAVENWVDSIAA